MHLIATFICGLLFSLGLIISGMINPAKVLGFLDIFGQWDASLAFVMMSAVLVTSLGYRFVLHKPNPIFKAEFSIPTKTDLDSHIVIGPALFGIGWGLAGLCPGPALAALTAAPEASWLFFVSMIAGMMLIKIWKNISLPKPKLNHLNESKT